MGSEMCIRDRSFGGFCILTYLSLFPDAIERALFTFGLAPVGRTADEVYAATYKRMEVPRGRPPRRDMGRYGEIWGVARLNIIWI